MERGTRRTRLFTFGCSGPIAAGRLLAAMAKILKPSRAVVDAYPGPEWGDTFERLPWEFREAHAALAEIGRNLSSRQKIP